MTTATRATRKMNYVTVETFTVKAASAVTKFMPVTLDSEGIVLDSVAGDNPVGIALEAGVAGALVQVALCCGGGVAAVKVGTAGATAGKYAEVGTTGLTDRTLGGGTTVRYLAGKFLQTGVSGEIVGLMLGNFAGVSA